VIKNFGLYVACAPFASVSAEIEKKGGMAFAKQKNHLLETSVVFPYRSNTSQGGSKALEMGWKVYVDGENIAAVWARKVLKFGPDPKESETDLRTSIILVPESAVLFYEDNVSGGTINVQGIISYPPYVAPAIWPCWPEHDPWPPSYIPYRPGETTSSGVAPMTFDQKTLDDFARAACPDCSKKAPK